MSIFNTFEYSTISGLFIYDWPCIFLFTVCSFQRKNVWRPLNHFIARSNRSQSIVCCSKCAIGLYSCNHFNGHIFIRIYLFAFPYLLYIHSLDFSFYMTKSYRGIVVTLLKMVDIFLLKHFQFISTQLTIFYRVYENYLLIILLFIIIFYLAINIYQVPTVEAR